LSTAAVQSPPSADPVLPSRWGLHGDLTWRALQAGVRACPWFLEPPLIAGWAAVVHLLAGRQRRAIAENLRVLMPETSWLRRQFLVWRTFYQFGSVTTDGIRCQQGEDIITWEVEGLEHFQAAEAQDRPVMLLTAHMGSYDAAGAFFARHMRRRLSAVRRPEIHPHLQELREEALKKMGDGAFHVLYNSSESILAVDLLRSLKNHEWVALQADRAMPGLSTMILEKDGRRWQLPSGPFTLAAAAQAQCLPTFIVRLSQRRYRVVFREALIALPGRDRRKSITTLAEQWISLFSAILREHQAQWLVFEPAFGSPGPNGTPGITPLSASSTPAANKADGTTSSTTGQTTGDAANITGQEGAAAR
jgi:KDO2-lipid IV(A) lauroyltransferase